MQINPPTNCYMDEPRNVYTYVQEREATNSVRFENLQDNILCPRTLGKLHTHLWHCCIALDDFLIELSLRGKKKI